LDSAASRFTVTLSCNDFMEVVHTHVLCHLTFETGQKGAWQHGWWCCTGW